MLGNETKRRGVPLHHYFYPLIGGAGLGFFIQYRKFERGFDSFIGIRLLLLMALFSLIILSLWKLEGVVVSRVVRTSPDKVLRLTSYGYGSLIFLFSYPLLRQWVLTDWHTSFRLTAAGVFLLFAVSGGVALFYAVRKPDGNRRASPGWSPLVTVLVIAILYYAHQISYIRTHESVWSNYTVADEVRKAITVFPGTSLRFNGVASRQSVGDLSIAVAPVNPVRFLHPECRLGLEFSNENGVRFDERSVETELRREWTECRMPVDMTGRDNVTVELRSILFPEKPLRRLLHTIMSYTDFPWREPRGFRLALTRPRILAGKSEAFPNVILISIDTLRADHVGVYGGGSLTPAMDSLADDGILFENAVVPSTWTLPSHMSMMTSLYASRHGIDDKTITVSDSPLTTIAELLQDAGYVTAAFTGNGYLSARYGFSEGFDSYYERYAGRGENEAAGIFARGEDWIRDHDDYRYFLFLHTYEAHNYLYLNKHHMLYTDEQYAGLFRSNSLAAILPGLGTEENGPRIESEDIQFIRDLYKGAVRVTDQEFGKFLTFLRDNQLYGGALIILTSDHGEGFGERHISPSPVWHHGREPYAEQVNVPLIVKLPADHAFSGRTSVDEWVSIMDIAPTVCDVAGLPIPDQFQGVSLIPIASTEETSRSRRIFTEVTYSQPFAIPPSVATYSKDSVYIHFPRSERGDELYDVQNDSGQHNNLADTRAADALVEAIESHLAESDYFSRPRYDKEPLDDKLADHLRALGYLK